MGVSGSIEGSYNTHLSIGTGFFFFLSLLDSLPYLKGKIFHRRICA
jgi:hypothetical protein